MASHSRVWRNPLWLEPWGTGQVSFEGHPHDLHLAWAGLLFWCVLLPSTTVVSTAGTEAVVGMVTLILVKMAAGFPESPRSLIFPCLVHATMCAGASPFSPVGAGSSSCSSHSSMCRIVHPTEHLFSQGESNTTSKARLVFQFL